ncbi:AAA family ATPase [Saccharopolyspora endophytica]|uniref:ATP-binding protein n=1 Tax=Saccharopolyspora endophytica TaxID=543886 RepID=A0ABS5D8W9_9PSEU|nr:AAA family ATPase [Saccharopolyspora endophytica]MBQ0922695.1 ATP-binding protein [Saccharopolyspora endophytica]
MDAREKIWRRLSEAGPLGLERVSITSSPVFAPDEMDWGRFTVLTGNHGAGKTYLLRTLVTSLPDRPQLGLSGPPTEPYTRLGKKGDGSFTYLENSNGVSGKHTMRHYADGVSTTWEVDLEQPIGKEFSGYSWPHEYPPPYGEYVDVVTAFDINLNWAFEHGRDDEAEKHTAGPFPYSAAELRVLRDITGRHYDELRWYSYEAEKDLIVPRPEGIVDGRTVPAERMSRGELWVHFLLYVVRTARPGSTIFIDEPETHLSPVGHVALLDELARSTLAHNIQTIIATHSTAMIARTPASMLRMLTPGPDGARMIRPATNEAALRTLGHRTSLGGLVFVEDELARRIVTAALVRCDRTLAEQVDVVDAGGRDEALAGARVLSRSQALQVCVLLDGDQREHVEGDRGFPVEFLPGNVPDEELLRQVHADPKALADLLARNVDDLVLALDQVRFAHHQFWFTRAARHLAVEEHVLVEHLVSLWLRTVEVEDEFRRVFAHVRDSWSRT